MTLFNLCRTRRSIGHGLLHASDFIQAAEGQPACGIIDINTMGSAVEACASFESAGMPFLWGTSFGLVWAEKSSRDTPPGQPRPLMLIPATRKGVEQLVALNTAAHTELFHYTPRLTLRHLTEAGEAGDLTDLVCVTGGPGSHLRDFLQTAQPLAVARLLEMLDEWTGQKTALSVSALDTNEDAEAVRYLAAEHCLPLILDTDTRVISEYDRTALAAARLLIGRSDDIPPMDTPSGLPAHVMYHELGLIALHNDTVTGTCHDGGAWLLDQVKADPPNLLALSGPHLLPPSLPGVDEGLGLLLRVEAETRPEEDQARVAAELAAIDARGLRPYLALVTDVCDFMRAEGIDYAVRGSASGSLVCHLLGITQVDPVQWGLRWDRFLSEARLDLPDIDLDIEADGVELVAAYLRKHWEVMRVGVVQTATCDEHTGKGSLVPRYFGRQRAKNSTITSWARVPDSHRQKLAHLGSFRTVLGEGRSAAGWLVTTPAARTVVPLMRVKGGEHVTQFTPREIERLGLLKLDLLSSHILSAMKHMPEESPEDPEVFAMLARGDTGGVFQLEGESATRGITDLGPARFEDIVHAMALFRPATLESGATAEYLGRRLGNKPIPNRHPVIRSVSEATYGVVLFQEQVMDLLDRVGVEAAVSHQLLERSKAAASDWERVKVVRAHRRLVEDACKAHGLGGADMRWVWDSIESFAAYGFNRAHAVAYARIVYRSAWLACHQPEEYFAALLRAAETTGDDRGPQWRHAARTQHNLTVSRPHVNKSQAHTRVESPGVVRAGLASVDGVGVAAAKAICEARGQVPFDSIEDMAERLWQKLGDQAEHVVPGTSKATKGRLSGMFDSLDQAGALKF